MDLLFQYCSRACVCMCTKTGKLKIVLRFFHLALIISLIRIRSAISRLNEKGTVLNGKAHLCEKLTVRLFLHLKNFFSFLYLFRDSEKRPRTTSVSLEVNKERVIIRGGEK